MSAVVVAQQHSALFQIQSGVALHEQAGGAVTAGGHIHRAALGTGGQRRLQPHSVVGLAVSHQTVAGSIHKEGLGLGGEIQLQGLALSLHLHRISGAGQQGEQGKYIGVAGFVYRLAVQGNRKGVCRTVAQLVFQLENGAAGHGTDQGQIHAK